jgi:hypothetical protein
MTKKSLGRQRPHVPFDLSVLIFSVFIIIYVLGVHNFEIPLGLDPSYQWLLTDAAESRKIFGGEFLGTYGPLGFVDFIYARDLATRVVALVWALYCYVLFFGNFWMRLSKSQIISSRFFAAMFSLVLVLVLERLLSPSLLFVFWMMLHRKKELSKLALVALSIVVALLFFVKLLPFGVAFLLLNYRIVINPKDGTIRGDYSFLRHLGFLAPTICSLILAVSTQGMRTWFKGYLESLVGYSAMASHPSNSIFVLIVYLFAVLALAMLSKESASDRRLFLLLSLIFLLYGFQRQDPHHLAPTFFLLTVFAVSQSLKGFGDFKETRLGGTLLTLLLGIVLFSLFSAGAGFNKWDTLIFLIFGGCVIILAVEKFRASILMSTLLLFVLVTTQSPFAITSAVFSPFPGSMTLKSRLSDSVTSIEEIVYGKYPDRPPNDDLVALTNSLKGYRGVLIATTNVYTVHARLDVEYLPTPMLFGVFTPWLDQQNVNFLSENKFDYLLFEKETPIDGSFWTTEAPATALYVFCNFTPSSNSDSWLLLYRLPSERCNSKDGKIAKVKQLTGPKITLADIASVRVIPGQHLFIDSDSYIRDDFGKRIGIQPKNSKGIMVRVPENLDYPKPWNINGILDLEKSNLVTFRELPLK